MGNIIEGAERLAALWQKGMDKMRESPWIFFLFLTALWGSSGWVVYFYERGDHKKDNQTHETRENMLTDHVIEAQLKTIDAQDKRLQAQDKRLEMLIKNQSDTSK